MPVKENKNNLNMVNSVCLVFSVDFKSQQIDEFIH
jgi:hypothetical protein